MTLTLELEPGVEARLQARAQAEGTDVDVLARRLVEDALGPVTLCEAISLYDKRIVTQGQAAALAGISRAEFIDALGKAGVSALQYAAEEALEEATRYGDMDR